MKGKNFGSISHASVKINISNVLFVSEENMHSKLLIVSFPHGNGCAYTAGEASGQLCDPLKSYLFHFTDTKLHLIVEK